MQIVPQEGKETTGLIGIVEDITLRKKLEQNLIQIERLRALGEMAGSVAHDENQGSKGGCPCRSEDPIQQHAVSHGKQGLWPAHAAGEAGGQDNSGNLRGLGRLA